MGGDAIPQRVIEEATLWLVRMRSGEATAADEDALRAWRAADPVHEEEWCRLMEIEGAFDSLPPGLRGDARRALESQNAVPTRRGLLKLLVLATATGGGAWYYRDEIGATRALADLSAGVGEMTKTTLPGGVNVALNTATAVDLIAGTPGLRLLQGELYIDAAAATAFAIETPPARLDVGQGRLSIRLLDGASRLTVIEGTVQVSPRIGAVHVANAGDIVRVTAAGTSPDPLAAEMDQTAWLNRRLVVDNMALEDFLAELWRYRRGVAVASAAVAQLRISGAFGLDDIDATLRAVEATLPVRARSLGPLGVWLEAEQRRT
ncbi:MAG: DUF4880 domain-containing protein [Pseudomonadota bacterium]